MRLTPSLVRVVWLAFAGFTGGLVASPFPAVAQAVADSAIVTGRVTTDAGAAIADAIVAVPSLRLSSTTNESGVYRILVPAARFVARADTLRVTRLGYRPATVPFTLAAGRVDVNVVMTAQAISLEQVLVTGTAGNQEKRAQAAVVSTIEAADLVRQAPITTVTQLLESRVPGVTLIEGSGATGSATRIMVRGAASINLSNQPLVFVDGVRVEGGSRTLLSVSGSGSATSQAPSALNEINPADIESIEIVKGPAAATLYGADASAGVIQIITKRGRIGSRSFVQEISLEYNRLEPNFTMPTNFFACTAPFVAPASTSALCRNQAVGTIISDNPAERLGFFRNGWMGSMDYSARGGGENYGFFASVSIANENGTTLNNTLQQRSGRGSFTFSPNEKLTFDLNFAFNRSEYELPRSDQDSYSYYVQSAFGVATGVTEDPNGGLMGGTLFATSTLESLSSIISRNTSTRVLPTAQVRFSPWPWFTHRLTLGADVVRGEGFQLFPKNPFNWYPDRTPFFNDLNVNTAYDRFYTVDYLGNVHWDLGASNQISTDLSFGSQYISRTNERLAGTGQGLISNDATLVTNANTSSVGQEFGEQRSIGLFAQGQVGLNDRLFLQAGLRADRNSAFGSDVGTFYLPKFGASYVISEEGFWAPLASVIPTFRLRAAYGTTGRSPAFGTIQTFQTTKFVNEVGQGELGVFPGNPGNPDLRPEKGEEFEAGFDAGFLNDRVGLELTYYNKKSTDLIVAVPSPPSAGFPTGGTNDRLANIGEVENSGFEFLLRATPVSRSSFGWDVMFTGTTLHNEILELGTVGTFINNFRAFTEGRQIGAFWAHRVLRVDEGAGRAIVSDTAEFIGNQLPTFQASLSNTITLFRNLRLYALLEGRRGHHVYNVNHENRDRGRQNSSNVVLPPEQGGYSTAERLRRLGPYFTEGGAPVGVSSIKDPYMQKADHIRLREVSATFVLPASLLRFARVTGASLTIGGRNLGLWKSDYEGDDPDVLGVGAATSGLNQLFSADVFTLPPNRRWIARINFQF